MNLDITERKRTETALDAAQERAETQKRALEAVLQALPVGVIIVDAQGGVVRANRCDGEIWGPRPDMRGIGDYAKCRAWWADSGRPLAPEEWAAARVVREGVPVIGQILKIERFDGGYRYAHNSAVSIPDEQGTVSGCAVAIQDITDLLEAEEALRAADRRKDEFLATLAHELRNPLAPRRTGLDLVRALRDAAACEQPCR
jgi:PAS domain-containing protein